MTMKRSLAVLLILVSVPVLLAQPADPNLAKAKKLAKESIIVDGHVDIPYRLHDEWEDISQRTAKGDFDYVRAKDGGLDAPFMSIYIPAERENNGAYELADTLIGLVETIVMQHPEKFAIAKSVADVRAQFAKGLISLPMGMENGSPIDHKIENVKYFADRGIRYITLTHGKANHISNSSYDTTRPWKGLSPFGDQVVSEMNKWGIMVDVSHLTDDAILRVLEITKAPVIASHSSCRRFTPGFERNISDDLIKKVGENGGVVMIAFASSFLSETYRQFEDRARREVEEYIAVKGWKRRSPEARAYIREYQTKNPPPFATVKDIADHIDNVVKVAGIDHVGFGSDFDGVGDSLPIGVKGPEGYPNIIAELLARGYSDQDIKKLCGENVLRVWQRCEEVAREIKGQ